MLALFFLFACGPSESEPCRDAVFALDLTSQSVWPMSCPRAEHLLEPFAVAEGAESLAFLCRCPIVSPEEPTP